MKALLFCCCFLFAPAVFSQQTDSIYTTVDEPALFPGGDAALHKWLAENMTYPDSLLDDKESIGKVILSFVVEKNGSLSQVRTTIGHHPELSRHLAGILLSMPKWQPARMQGQAVRSQFQLPVTICFK